jgi:hypothetical protein
MGQNHLQLNFVDQDLRNRSFRRQRLNGADFRRADLRGCSFQQAELVNANFEQARMGQSRRQKVIWWSTAIATLLLAGNAISTLVAGSLGQTPTDKAWAYVVALVICLGVAGGLAGIHSKISPSFKRWSDLVAGSLATAVVGFYYAGSVTDKDPRWAIAGAVVGAGVALAWGWRQTISSTIAFQMMTTLAAYGFSFLVGATAIALVNVGNWLPGILVSLVSLLFLWLTWRGWVGLGKLIFQTPGTSFQGANLTQAHFSQGVRSADFTGAIGKFSDDNANFRDGV